MALPHLPDDLWWLIERHVATLCVQRTWRRRVHFRHARHVVWERVRAHIGSDMWRKLLPFYNVRLEWYKEPHVWLDVDDYICTLIYHEASQLGLWGARSRYLATT